MSEIVRQLEPGEEPRFLALLDGWPFGDGRKGSDFFRKYVDQDSRFEPANVWVAEDEGELVTCVQIFPRDMWLRGERVAVGGIGSVFTAPSHRRRGLAEKALECAAGDMRDRGMVLSLLSGTRAKWYGALGWKPWPETSTQIDAPASLAAVGATTIRPFDRATDLETCRQLHAQYTTPRCGSIARTEDDWESSLRVAGHPLEDIWVGLADGRTSAYLRGTNLGSGWVATEWGGAQGSELVLADLFAHAGALQETRSFTAPRLADASLAAALDARGLRVHEVEAPEVRPDDPRRPVWMIRPLAEGATLASLFGDQPFHFWPSDRF